MIKCPHCFTENADENAYCAGCGAVLGEAPQADPNQITEAEMEAFVGNKAHHYIPKFKNFAMGGTISFNLPVFLLGLFFGPIISSFWFFHRKMKKIGAIILAIGLLLSAISLVSFLPSFSSFKDLIVVAIEEELEYEESSEYYDDFYYEDDFEFDETNTATMEFAKTFIGSSVFSIFVSILNLAVLTVTTIYADNWYYKFAIKSIHESKREGKDSLMELSLKGGTNAVVWVFILIGYIILNFSVAGWLLFELFKLVAETIPMP